MNERYGQTIEICVGAGVNLSNVQDIVTNTSITQVHSSFKGWFIDPTTHGNVSYKYNELGDYEGVSAEKLKKFIELLKEMK